MKQIHLKICKHITTHASFNVYSPIMFLSNYNNLEYENLNFLNLVRPHGHHQHTSMLL